MSLMCAVQGRSCSCERLDTCARFDSVHYRSCQLPMCCLCCDQEKEDWINAVGRAIVRHSKR